MVSHKFGFGAVDAEALVIRARNWATVPPQRQSTLSFTPSVFGYVKTALLLYGYMSFTLTTLVLLLVLLLLC